MIKTLQLFAIENNKLPTASPDLALPGVLQFIFRLAGALALLVIIIGALRYVLSRGDANAIKTSKETIIYALVGLLVAMTGYGIVTFVFGRIR